jgi:hypothetical protein
VLCDPSETACKQHNRDDIKVIISEKSKNWLVFKAKAGLGQSPGKLLLIIRVPSWSAIGGRRQGGKWTGDDRPTYSYFDSLKMTQ